MNSIQEEMEQDLLQKEQRINFWEKYQTVPGIYDLFSEEVIKYEI